MLGPPNVRLFATFRGPALFAACAFVLTACDGRIASSGSESNSPGSPGSGVGGSPPGSLIYLTGPQAGVGSMVLDATNLYWTTVSNGMILTCPIAGCGGPYPTLLADYQSNSALGQLFLGRGLLYWGSAFTSNYYYVMECPTTGCNDQPTAFLTGGFGTPFAIDDANLYLKTIGDYDALIGACPLGSSCDGVLTTITSARAPNPIIEDGGVVYWFDQSEAFTVFLKDCPVSGCNDKPTNLVTLRLQYAPQEIGNLTAWGSALYWTQENALWTCPKAGCSQPSKLRDDDVFGLTITSTGIYFCDANDSTWTCPLDNCDSPTLVIDGACASLMDDTWYFGVTPQGIFKAAR